MQTLKPGKVQNYHIQNVSRYLVSYNNVDIILIYCLAPATHVTYCIWNMGHIWEIIKKKLQCVCNYLLMFARRLEQVLFLFILHLYKYFLFNVFDVCDKDIS